MDIGCCYHVGVPRRTSTGSLTMPNDSTTELQRWLDLSNLDDPAAKEGLIRHSCERLTRLTRKMLKGYPRLQRWEQTDDVLQETLKRLYQSLDEVKPASVREFFGLAAKKIHGSLLDLARHHFGAHGDAAHHETDNPNAEDRRIDRQADARTEPKTLDQWRDFHEWIEHLPEKERELLELLYYEGLTQQEAASVLGIDVRTVRRHVRAIKFMIHDALGIDCPE